MEFKALKNKQKTLMKRVWNTIFFHLYDHSKINPKWLFAESRFGAELAGNIFYTIKELSENNSEYGNLKIFLSAKRENRGSIRKMLEKYNIKGVKLVRAGSLIYFKTIFKSKYLINDNTFPRPFIKKPGQIYINTWHGTPLKHMGIDILNQRWIVGNAIRNLIFSDYLIFPNKYCEEIMLRTYCVYNTSSGTVIRAGYPRNTIFFDEDARNKLKAELSVSGKKIYVYMPTWRSSEDNALVAEVQKNIEISLAHLREIDSKLNDDEIFYVKFHQMLNTQCDFNDFKHVRAFPSGYETYQVLNLADVLITDYSSVFYDFANTRRKIILFPYDKKEYFENRGVYGSLDELPFPQVTTVSELIDELGRPKNYDDSDFIKKYCTYDNIDATKNICKRIFLNQKTVEEEKVPSNGKKNVIIYSGNLDKNGITSAFLSLLENIDLTKNNYYVSYRQSTLKKNQMNPAVIPDGVGIIPISADIFFDFKSAHAYNKFAIKGVEKEKYKKILKHAYDREFQRHFFGIDIDHFIHYSGYETCVEQLLISSPSKKSIFVHNDMVQEIELKGNQNKHVLKWTYSVCDHVLPVSKDIVEPTYQISGRRDNIMVMNNFHNHELVVKKGEMPVEFQADTEIFCPHPDGVNHILEADGMKFITIGRFSPEKGHFRLIDAFDEFHKTHPDSSLIIIGGLGVLYTKTIEHVREKSCWKNIILIKSVQNPMPILKKCDLFIISSFYEGLPMVLHEADSLGVPAFATDVNGPGGYFREFGGYLVEDSTEGVLQGMYDFAAGKIKPMNIDYAKRNEQIRKKLEEIL